MIIKNIIVFLMLLTLASCGQFKITRYAWVDYVGSQPFGDRLIDSCQECSLCFGFSAAEAKIKAQVAFKQALDDIYPRLPDELNVSNEQAFLGDIHLQTWKNYAKANKAAFMPSTLAFIDKQKCEAFYEKMKPSFY